jgi:thioredoxin-dependent peroxiredoxin
LNCQNTKNSVKKESLESIFERNKCLTLGKSTNLMKHLKIGDKAPDFKTEDQNGNPINLNDFSGSKVILYFYPKDNTPGCTAQACNLTDNYNQLIKNGYKVLGVSADSAKSHQKFVEKYSLPFPLLMDEEKKIIQDYGVWGEKKFMGKVYDGIHRTTFVIDENGVIEEIIEKVKTKDHSAQILG